MGHYQDIDIILNDIKELYEMVKGFREETNIPNFIVKLAENKAEKIKTGLGKLMVGGDVLNVQESLEEPVDTLANRIEEKEKPIVETVQQAETEVAVEAIQKEHSEEKAESLSPKESIKEKIVAQISSYNEPVERRLIVDVRKSISLNDRFRFQRELFNNDSQYMNKVLDEIGQYSQLSDVLNYLKETFHWEKDNQAATDFIKIVIKKYS